MLRSGIALGAFSLGLLGALCLPPSGFTQQDDKVALKMKFRKGDISRYQTVANLVSKISLAGQTPTINTVDVNLVQQMTVTRAFAKGGGEVATSTLTGRMLSNGKPFATPLKTPLKTVYDGQGNLLQTSWAPVAGQDTLVSGILGSGTLGMQRVYLPPRPVEFGEVWTQEVRVPGMTLNGKGVAKAKIMRYEKTGRYRTVRIHADVTLPLKIYLAADNSPLPSAKGAASALTGTLTMSIDSHFAPKEGKVIKAGGNGVANFAMTSLSAPKGKNGAKNAALPSNIKIGLEMNFGNNLQE